MTYLRSPEGLVELNCDIVVDGIIRVKRFELYSRFSNDYILCDKHLLSLSADKLRAA